MPSFWRTAMRRTAGSIRMLAENEAHFVRDARVAAAARSVLPALRRRLNLPDPPAPTLFRAAAPLSSEPDALLRSDHTESGADLLRAAS